MCNCSFRGAYSKGTHQESARQGSDPSMLIPRAGGQSTTFTTMGLYVFSSKQLTRLSIKEGALVIADSC